MSHVFFFSYASTNRDKELEKFFEDLCDAVKVYTTFGPRDPRLSFRDGNNLPLMVDWEPQLMQALQSSSVMVSVTSRAYFASRFCGQEYFAFDQRRRAKDPMKPAPVILPVIWAPDPEAPIGVLDEVQWKTGEIHADYKSRGLRSLMKRMPEEYERCVALFGEAIGGAYMKAYNLPVFAPPGEFGNIPNAFAGVVHGDEGTTPNGWLSGPSLANFAFATGCAHEFPSSNRHGSRPAEWRPYLPPEPPTITELSRRAAKKLSLYFREIPLDHHFEKEVESSQKRGNLTIVIAEPAALSLPRCSAVRTFDRVTATGTAVLIPRSEPVERPDVWIGEIRKSFPIRSTAAKPPFHPAIDSHDEFEAKLESTLTEIRSAVIKELATSLPPSDSGPIVLSGEK